MENDPGAIQRQRLADLPAQTREWLETRAPDVPRTRFVPILTSFLFGVLAVALIAGLAANGLAAFRYKQGDLPFYIFAVVFGALGGRHLVRELRLNQLGKKSGYALGFHFSPTATYWRDTLNTVWTIPPGCVYSIDLESSTGAGRRDMEIPALLRIVDVHGNSVTAYDLDLPVLWRALRDHYPEAKATFDTGLKDQCESEKPSEPIERLTLPEREKRFALGLLGLLVFSGCGWLVISKGGLELQTRFLGSYVTADATVVKITIEEYDIPAMGSKGRRKHGLGVYLQANYTVDQRPYSGRYEVRDFDLRTSATKKQVEKEAINFARTFKHVGDHLCSGSAGNGEGVLPVR